MVCYTVQENMEVTIILDYIDTVYMIIKIVIYENICKPDNSFLKYAFTNLLNSLVEVKP